MNALMKLKPVIVVLVTFALLTALSTTAFGQCSMCRSALAGSGNAFFVRNFNIGVLVLLVPPVTIFCSIFVALKRYKKTDDQDQGDQTS
jgi:ABC-type transport system involved in multi-copper enzyme maturation permease subunit